MSTPTPIVSNGINNLTNFLGSSNYQVQLILVVGSFIMIFIAVGFILKTFRKRR